MIEAINFLSSFARLSQPVRNSMAKCRNRVILLLGPLHFKRILQEIAIIHLEAFLCIF